MDIHTGGDPPSIAEREAVDDVLGSLSTVAEGEGGSTLAGHVAFGGHAFRHESRPLLLPVLHSVQERIGWISRPALNYICTRLGVAPAEAYGVASAYALLSVKQAPATVIHICDDIACRAASGADPTLPAEKLFGPEWDEREGVTWTRSPCLGQCEHGSAMLIQRAGTRPERRTVAPGPRDVGDTELLVQFLKDTASIPSQPDPSDAAVKQARPLLPQRETDPNALRLLRRVGIVDPSSIDSYRLHGGYDALRRAFSLGPDGTIQEIKDARLLGRGGAAFPTGVKWQAVASNSVRPHYFVCNADESEPGTFKDRILIEHDPFALIEALTIAGYATGCEKGFIYIRGEYPFGEVRVANAVMTARQSGLLGADILGAGFGFDIEVRRGAGAYIAGEETALFNSIEGKRPEPRNKPPYPAQSGLFGKPTAVNNVETLFNVLEIMSSGAGSFAQTGTKDSTGTRLFCVSGSVEKPGLYEYPMGISLRQLLTQAGGMPSGKPPGAILLGGAAGFFVSTKDLGVPLSFEGVKSAGLTLGSGVVIAFDETLDMNDIVMRIAKFFRDESCGQCVPCRVGTVRQQELLQRLVTNKPLRSREDELTLLSDLGAVMRDASICGLGQTATSAVESALRLGLIANLLPLPYIDEIGGPR